jgi:hypothetical protein
MKNPEEAIDKVLTGLRDVHAPAGMEGRILGVLEEKASARGGLGWRMWRMWPEVPAGARYVACGVALAGLFAVALAIPAIRRIGRPATRAKVNQVRGGLVSAAPSEMTARDASISMGRQNSGPREMTKVPSTNPAMIGETVRESDSVAVSEMLTPSFPAPPMPLTEQEKLLLRIVHQGDPVEIAMLNPVLRDAQNREEEAEVKRFFEPPTAEPSTTKQPVAEPPTMEQSTKGDQR